MVCSHTDSLLDCESPAVGMQQRKTTCIYFSTRRGPGHNGDAHTDHQPDARIHLHGGG